MYVWMKCELNNNNQKQKWHICAMWPVVVRKQQMKYYCINNGKDESLMSKSLAWVRSIAMIAAYDS